MEAIINMNSDLVHVITIKFSKSSKEYTYLCDDQVKSGDYVSVEGKTKYFQVVSVKDEPISKLPVDYSEMKRAKLVDLDELKLAELLEDSEMLKRFGKPIKLIGRNDIIEELVVSLGKKRMKNTILIGEAGCGKTTIVEAFADMVKESYYVLGFTVGELVSGTSFRGMMEKRITETLSDVLTFNKEHNKKIILFIDEIHLIANSYSTDECSIADFMKTYLTDENMIIIGATTINEFNSSIKKDRATMRRLAPLYVPNLSDEAILDTLKDFSSNSIDDELLDYIIGETNEIPNTTNPDISIEIVDRAMARRDVLGKEINLDMITKIINNLKMSIAQ